MNIHYLCFIVSECNELEIDCKPCLPPGHAHTHAQTDGQPENIMPAVPSTKRAKTKKCMLIFYYFLVYEINEIDGTTLAASTTFGSLLTTH